MISERESQNCSLCPLPIAPQREWGLGTAQCATSLLRPSRQSLPRDGTRMQHGWCVSSSFLTSGWAELRWVAWRRRVHCRLRAALRSHADLCESVHRVGDGRIWAAEQRDCEFEGRRVHVSTGLKSCAPPFLPRALWGSSSISMDVGAPHSGGRQGRPRGRQIAPDGSPGPPKCEDDNCYRNQQLLEPPSRPGRGAGIVSAVVGATQHLRVLLFPRPLR